MSKNVQFNKEDNDIEETKEAQNNEEQKIEEFPNLHRNKNFRSLMIRRMEEDEKYNKYIQTEIDDYFNSPDKYFDKNSPVAINQKINLKDINLFQKGPVKRLTNKKTNKIINNLSNYSQIKRKNVPSVTSSGNINNIPEQLPRYEIIDNEKLKYIFDIYQDPNYKKSFIKENRLDLKKNSFPFDLSKSLSVQNNRLRSSRNNQKNLRQMSGYLSRRLNKKEKDLLINSIDSYRYKKELIKNINNKDFCEIQPRYYWKMNLRRDNDLERRDLYVNIKDNYDPFFSVIVDNTKKKKEVTFKSGLDLNSKELKDFKKNKYLIDKHSKNIRNLEKLDNLNIKGKNLFNLEFNREMSSKRRKILHRVFVENGKEIMDTDINEVFGEETIYKNYTKDSIRYEKKKENNSNNSYSRNTNDLI